MAEHAAIDEQQAVFAALRAAEERGNELAHLAADFRGDRPRHVGVEDTDGACTAGFTEDAHVVATRAFHRDEDGVVADHA